jgi:ATP-binding protein involved in chromosome partitioning
MFSNPKIHVPVLGLVENMAYFAPAEFPDNRYYIFGKDGGKRLAEELKLPLLGEIPLVAGICDAGDQGKPVALNESSVTGLAFHRLAQQVIARVDDFKK